MARYALTDLHGCPKTFLQALSMINLKKSDDLFLLGDYIDRGPDSLGVLRVIWELEENGYNVTCLRGNHEQMLLDHHAGKLKLYDWTPPLEERQRTLDWMKALDYHHETPGYILVHAGLNFKSPTPLLDKQAMLWERYWYNDVDRRWLDGRIILHGHTPEPKIALEEEIQRIEENGYLDLDTGCAHNSMGMGWLTAFDLDSRELTFVKRLD